MEHPTIGLASIRKRRRITDIPATDIYLRLELLRTSTELLRKTRIAGFRAKSSNFHGQTVVGREGHYRKTL